MYMYQQKLASVGSVRSNSFYSTPRFIAETIFFSRAGTATTADGRDGGRY